MSMSTSRDSAGTGPLPSLKRAFAQQPSPLHMNLENSRRFRALPLYANLTSLGRHGYSDIVCRNIAFARAVEQWLRDSPDWEVLAPSVESSAAETRDVFKVMNIVLFAPAKQSKDAILKTEAGAAEAVRRINEERSIYVSGTRWRGRPAIRMAVSNVRRLELHGPSVPTSS